MGSVGQTKFQHEDITPDPAELTESLAASDEAEACRRVKLEARPVLREDAGLDGPHAGRRGSADEVVEQSTTDTSALVRRCHVHAVLDDARIEHRSDTSPAATHPITSSPIVPTKQRSARCDSSHASRPGTLVSNVALPVAIPAA